MRKGFYTVPRSDADHFNFLERSILNELVRRARFNGEERDVKLDVELDTGEFVFGTDELADKARVSRRMVRKVLLKFRLKGLIEFRIRSAHGSVGKVLDLKRVCNTGNEDDFRLRSASGSASGPPQVPQTNNVTTNKETTAARRAAAVGVDFQKLRQAFEKASEKYPKEAEGEWANIEAWVHANPEKAAGWKNLDLAMVRWLARKASNSPATAKKGVGGHQPANMQDKIALKRVQALFGKRANKLIKEGHDRNFLLNEWEKFRAHYAKVVLDRPELAVDRWFDNEQFEQSLREAKASKPVYE